MLPVYETLLGHLKDNPVIGKYLQGDTPDWANLWVEAMPMLSSGEQIMVQVGLALYNGHATATIADIFKVDPGNRRRILDAIELRLSEYPS